MITIKLQIENIGHVCGDSIVDEIQKWQSKLDADIFDSIIYETLDTVLDIIIDNAVGEVF